VTPKVTGRPPKAMWRSVPEDQFPLLGLLRLLFERPDSEQDEPEGGADAVA
jgi:hypothetical protein